MKTCSGLQEALDRLEVCLQALGKPVAPLKYAMDFGRLPYVPIPPSEPAQAPPGSSGADDSGPAEEVPPSADEADDTAPEELGDSTREAQNRGEAYPYSSRAIRLLPVAVDIWTFSLSSACDVSVLLLVQHLVSLERSGSWAQPKVLALYCDAMPLQRPREATMGAQQDEEPSGSRQ